VPCYSIGPSLRSLNTCDVAMTSSYIRFGNVWKRFRRGEIHDSLRDLVPAVSRQLLGRVRNGSAAALQPNEFWAVRDVSFEVEPGKALGIIGGNGAGKSTILKILTRILRPTAGTAEIRGRAGALIEVSAGFHQDLTGRENVFLQGSIMGMPMALIREKFDEIVEFSGIAEFLDTPVKRYSSGMQARLGFSIAAHLDPDVLIIDEVLSVGDFRFQDRAFGRIRELVSRGLPVVIVSHQLDRIASLCNEAIVLDRGVAVYRGDPADCIAWYLSGNRASSGDGKEEAAIQIHQLTTEGPAEVPSGADVGLTLIGTISSASAASEDVALRVRSATSGSVAFETTLARCGINLLSPGEFRVRVDLEMNLRPGVYTIEPNVINVMTHNDVGTGPLAYIQVASDPGFVGYSHLRPRMRLL